MGECRTVPSRHPVRQSVPLAARRQRLILYGAMCSNSIGPTRSEAIFYPTRATISSTVIVGQIERWRAKNGKCIRVRALFSNDLSIAGLSWARRTATRDSAQNRTERGIHGSRSSKNTRDVRVKENYDLPFCAPSGEAVRLR